MLGVCYYPEHWSKEQITSDIPRMRELGIQWVRIGEFAWSLIEPAPGKFEWQWLDEVLNLFELEELKVILGTPTATPPKWLVDRYPDILPVDKEGRIRKFGSRRHYCFSNSNYREEVRRIVSILAQRYGNHRAVSGWQLDNEYGCHDTVRCYCPSCQKAFRMWLENRYGDIDTLNEAWGTSFWSQRYRSFEEIELPNLTVTTPNPSHLMDYFRFSSNQVCSFNQLQVEILRELSPHRFITHNFMGGFVDFDHFTLAQDLDLASWDSYPLGHTISFFGSTDLEESYIRRGHPDISAFSNDLYREVGGGRFWIMEQQAGPVNWAPYNPIPAPGMVRLWTLEAIAHGAEVVSYFRWRQVPFAQEQMHSGLLRPDSTPGPGFYEVQKVARELANIELPSVRKSSVALIFDYEAAWVFEIQPHGEGVSYLHLVFQFYSALRQLGLDVDVLSPRASLEGYKFVVVPSLPIVSKEALESLQDFAGIVVFGPRTGSKTETYSIPPVLPPGPLQELISLKVTQVESLPPQMEKVHWQNREYPVGIWKEWVETELQPEMTFADGRGAAFRYDRYYYFAFWPGEALLVDFFAWLVKGAGLNPERLPKGLRLRRRGDLVFAFNFADQVSEVPAPATAHFLLGSREIQPGEVAIWRE